jgi:hypothetical protein
MADLTFELLLDAEAKKVEDNMLPTSEDYIVTPMEDFRQLGYLKRFLNLTGGFIAGGAFKNIFNGEPVKDLDIFFQSEAAWWKAVKKLKRKGYTQIYKNARVRAFKDPITGIRLELIGAKTDPEFQSNPVDYESVENTIKMFDFTVTKFAVARKGDIFYAVYHPKFFEHLHLKRLSIDAEMVKPLSTFERTLRYVSYGYKLCRDSKIELINAIQETEFEPEAQLNASFYDGVD